MASINYRLQTISSNLFIKHNSTERVYIDGRISILTSNLKSYFGNSISDVKIFGSYKRDTILPRKFDENSDIDILVIFNQAEKVSHTAQLFILGTNSFTCFIASSIGAFV